MIVYLIYYDVLGGLKKGIVDGMKQSVLSVPKKFEDIIWGIIVGVCLQIASATDNSFVLEQMWLFLDNVTEFFEYDSRETILEIFMFCTIP